jgi:aminopeptidase
LVFIHLKAYLPKPRIETGDLRMKPAEAAQNALQYVLEAKKGEKLVIFCDDSRAAIGEAFEAGAEALGVNVKLIVLGTEPQVFRKEIPPKLMKYLTTQRADVYVNLFRGVREETPFRIKFIHLEADGKTRLGHCPGVTLDMLTEGSLALTAEEHAQTQTFAAALMEKIKDAVRFEIKTPAGTKLSLSMKGRAFITDTKLDRELMKWMNLPTGEVYGAPVEDSLQGTLVCDMAVGGIGPLKEPVTLKVKAGKVDAVKSENTDVLKRVQDTLHTDAMAKVVGEFAFGVNPKARLVEEFLEDEKMLGTVHIAFGDNTDMPGGKNTSSNHMDLMMNKPTVTAFSENGSKILILKDGIFQLKPSAEEKLPISDFYKVVDYATIFKSDLWWEAAVIFEVYGKRQFGLYLWQKRGGEWKRKNKFGFRNLDEWVKIKAAIDQLAPKVAGK